MQGHIVKIKGYEGLWIVIESGNEYQTRVMSLDGEGFTMSASRRDVTARTDDYAVNINTYIFDDTKTGA
jgi:hypothetical protein